MPKAPHYACKAGYCWVGPAPSRAARTFNPTQKGGLAPRQPLWPGALGCRPRRRRSRAGQVPPASLRGGSAGESLLVPLAPAPSDRVSLYPFSLAESQ